MIDITSLKALAAVESHGSVVAASDVMRLSPSAVSQQIKKLERETGIVLLERNGRGVLLTDRGLALAAYGRRILSELEELQSTLLADPAKPTGILKLVAFSTACRGLLGPALGRLATGASELDISVIAEDPREAVARVASGEADLGIVHNWNSVPLVIPEHMSLEWLCEDVADLLVHRDHPLAGRASVEPRDLVDEQWVSTPAGAICNEALLRIFADVGRVPAIKVYDPDFATHIALVEQAVVVALVPRLGRPALPAEVVAVPVVNPAQVRQVGLVHRRTMTASPAIRHVAAVLREVAAPVV
ncbi:LysR substrate-binding domain-containing protein [Pseudarthrobacter sp. J64]|uniref:LysR family transcriptional regulator n=1 Tax=Pseudarthrobacter sp. J64 TaxID=3116485 RepID=UPI002E80AA95|nr:LysR substrate-binding domain-containing protein [Pseudarthrobacter sp. J64]MEE2570459.1 LysR substrate-binding domain-containing protein [Pseudarthrobacter sp. J64]